MRSLASRLGTKARYFQQSPFLSVPSIIPRSLYTGYSTGKMSAVNQPDITLYTAQTPNGIKISIALEELGCVSFYIRTYVYGIRVY